MTNSAVARGSNAADRDQPSAAPRLEVERLGMRVGDRWLLRDIAFAVRPGEMVGLVGANGAGKSTLLRAMSGFIAPSAGTVRLDGVDLRRLSGKARARAIAVVPQTTAVEGAITTEALVLMGRHPHLGRFAIEGKRDRAIAALAMRATETDHLATRAVGTLSGGERQRAVIARALAQEPRLLLLDEPTANLDLRHQVEVLSLARRLAADGQLAVVTAIHDLRLASRMCDRLLVLRDGQLVADGAPTAVITPDLLADAFGVRSELALDPVSGLPELVMSPAATTNPRATRVHIIAGGGRGAAAIVQLAAAGFPLSVGVLGAGDTDLHAARLAGARVITHPSFAAIDPETDRAHRLMVSAADVVVVADVPWGRSNLANLEAVMDAPRVLLLDGEPVSRRDFTGGVATELVARLASRSPTVPVAQLTESIVAMFPAP